MSVLDQDLQWWQELSEQATPGPWKTCGAQLGAKCSCGLVWSIPADSPVAAWHSEDGHAGRSQDVLFIAAARTAIPALIAEVKALRKLVDLDGEIIERLTSEKENLRAEVERLSAVYAVASSLRTFPVPFDDHLRLVDAVDAAEARDGEGQR